MALMNRIESYYEYDEEMLKHMQKIQLMILKDFTKLCDDNNIEYFVDGGSCIGCIRHKGFIPWDDDVDVIMFRDQFEKLVEVFNKTNCEKYELLCPQNNDDYIRIYGHFSLKDTRCGVFYDNKTSFNIGISLEIFILDNFPNSKFKQKLTKFRRAFYREFRSAYEISYNDLYISKNKERLGHIIRFFFNLFGFTPKKIQNIVKRSYNKHNNEKTDYVANWSTTYEFKPIPRKYFSPAKKMPFEDIEVSVPNDYDGYLKEVYGDYMKIPPVEERANHPYTNVDFGPYKK